jgi:uncharacterized protein (TIGR03067 family)
MLKMVSLLTILLAAPPDEAARREQKQFDGDWRMVSVEVEGAKMPAQQVNGLSLVFKAGKFTSYNNGDKKTGTYSIDHTQTPKRLDIVHAEGPEKGKTWSLIYSLEGNTLKICGPIEIGKERPTSFDAKDKKGLILMVLRHQ